MVLNKIIYDVREALNQYIDDSQIDDRYIIYLYGIKRAKYLRQDENNFQRTTDISVKQTFCLELESIPINQCNVNIECDEIVRTVKPIPQPLDLHVGNAITNIKPTNRIALPFNFVDKNKAIYSEYSPFNKSIFAFLDTDRYIYLVSKTNALNLLDCISITGVFEDPLELLNYSNCCSCEIATPCLDYDTINYPLQPHYIDLIKEEIVQQLIQKLQIPEDKENNSDD